ncbi:enoyl-CoA hydratase/isomerase family protein [Diaphorobacter sp. HDW4B]|uniref:enoyl-CoA hydratase/isomerase family protein n=1 Tax=Diaphorobacter sp. HDW4B TaxID=2714925 RepID=UPI00140A00B3|nr:enoyl-CoA hydratase/isomerase family protein [Diaphorobacter sp. HDW4B]QIL69407.1 enoyl-CoA hydratase/isomerase family protein [Diaphorobacter sp. HDW4B]
MTTNSTEDWVIATRQGAVFNIHLNRGESRNPLGGGMVPAMSAALHDATQSPEVRVILFTAAGPAFSAGGNLGNIHDRLSEPMGTDGRDPVAAGNRQYGEFLTQLVHCPKVTVASVQGAAMGGGAGLACAVDISIGSPVAKFGFPEVTIGLVPGQILPFVAARLGLQTARRLVLTGERIDAKEAHRIGLLDYLADSPETLPEKTQEVLRHLIAAAPNASVVTKRMLSCVPLAPLAGNADLPTYLDAASHWFASQMRTEAVEGVTASRDKRAASWNPTQA